MTTLKPSSLTTSVKEDIREMGWGARIMFSGAVAIMGIFFPLAVLAGNAFVTEAVPFDNFWPFFYISSFALSIPALINTILFAMWWSWRDVTKAPISDNQRNFSIIFIVTSAAILISAIIGFSNSFYA